MCCHGAVSVGEKNTGLSTFLLERERNRDRRAESGESDNANNVVAPLGSTHRRPQRWLQGEIHAARYLPVAEAEAVEAEAVEVVVVGRGEGAVRGPRGEAPLCPVPSRAAEQEEGEQRVMVGEGGVVGTGAVLGMSLM